MKLTEHFTLEELTQSNAADIYNIDNTPSKNIIVNLQEVANLLEKIRTKWKSPIIVTSGYRCAELNKKIGGVPTSQHLKGQAADITSRDNKQLFLLISQMVLDGEIKVGQLIDEKKYKWLHISTPHLKINNQILHLK